MASTLAPLRQLTPAYFALVMATGILSIATLLLGYRNVSTALLVAGLAFHALLIGLMVLRGLRFGTEMRADLDDPSVMFGFFTFVAGGNVLGTRLTLGGAVAEGLAFWLVGLAAWLILTYYTMAVLIFRNDRPLEQVVDGGWLTAIVAAQSVCVLSATLVAAGAVPGEPTLLLAFGVWAVGSFFYAVFITFIMLALCFRATVPDHIQPAYWINMGALAISTVAGAMLIRAADGIAFAEPLIPFVLAITIALWCGATWWLPLIIGMGVWKHVARRVPLRYEPALWSMVFPLGMYSVASWQMTTLFGLEFLAVPSRLFMWIALFAWAATLLGLLVGIGRCKADGTDPHARKRTGR